jgi:hypothetical protein
MCGSFCYGVGEQYSGAHPVSENPHKTREITSNLFFKLS